MILVEPGEERSKQKQEQSKGPEAAVYLVCSRSSTDQGVSNRTAGRSRRALRAMGRTLAFALGEMRSHLQGCEKRSNMM